VVNVVPTSHLVGATLGDFSQRGKTVLAGRLLPKQEYTAEFKEQAVKRADEISSIARTAEELGLVEQTLRNCVLTQRNLLTSCR
jgi:transposase-like protein